MFGVGRKTAMGAFAAAAWMMGPLAGEASAAGGCAEWLKVGIPCGKHAPGKGHHGDKGGHGVGIGGHKPVNGRTPGGHPNEGGNAIEKVPGAGGATLTVYKCDRKNLEYLAQKLPIKRCPNLTMEETKLRYPSYFR